MCIYLDKCERQCLNTVLTNNLCKMLVSTKKKNTTNNWTVKQYVA